MPQSHLRNNLAACVHHSEHCAKWLATFGVDPLCHPECVVTTTHPFTPKVYKRQGGTLEVLPPLELLLLLQEDTLPLLACIEQAAQVAVAQALQSGQNRQNVGET